MKLTYDELLGHPVIPFPLEVQNHLLRLFGPGAYNLRSVANLVNTDDFKSFCIPPDYVACKMPDGDITILAITTKKLNDLKQAEFLVSCEYQLNSKSVLYISLIGKSLVVIEAHYDHDVRVTQSCALELSQAIITAQRLIGGSM